jgi:MFS transporter, SP family, sugar:H+ symporter
MEYVKKQFGHELPDGTYNVYTWEKSLITSILSAGTFFGALFAGWFADFVGRRIAILVACAIFMYVFFFIIVL